MSPVIRKEKKGNRRVRRAKFIIGRKDIADLPDLGIFGIEVKVDTGAYTSSIHCHDIREVDIDRKKAIMFYLLDPHHPEYNGGKFFAHNFVKKKIKNSGGNSEIRYVIRTRLVLFGKDLEVSLSLADRKKMATPVLVGRQLLNKYFVVDTSQTNLSAKGVKRRIYENRHSIK